MKNVFAKVAITAAFSLSVLSLQAKTIPDTVYGSIESVDLAKQELTLKINETKNITLKANSIEQVTVVNQAAVGALSWPARTFTYTTSNGDALRNLTVGQQVELKLL